jgi:hypothetical protein
MRSDDEAQAVQWATRRLQRLLDPEALQRYLREPRLCESCAIEGGAPAAVLQISESGVRGLRSDDESARASHRQQPFQREAGEHPDALRQLPRYAPQPCPTCWASGRWEDGVPRIATGVKNRVDRLKGLGNAIVPQIAEWIARRILDAD